MSRSEFSPHHNLDDLPEELKKELKLSNVTDKKILDLFKKGGETLNISEVLVGLYKVYKEVKTRQFVSAALYRMRAKNLVFPTGKKGEYTTDLAKTKDSSEMKISN